MESDIAAIIGATEGTFLDPNSSFSRAFVELER